MSFPYRHRRMNFKPKSTIIQPRYPWLRVVDCAKLYDVHSQTVRHWYLSGKLRSVKYRGIIYVRYRKFII